MGKLKSYQEQLQDIVEKGINAAEEQQKKLASKPFDYAEKLEAEAREYSVKSLRKRYNGYSETLFEQLRSLNGRFGNFAAELVAKLEKEAAESADLGPAKEEPHLLPGSAARPGDVLIRRWHNGQDVAVDVTVANPLSPTYVAGAAAEAGKTLSKAYDRKMRDTAEACRTQGLKFSPLAVETLGGFHCVATDVVRRLGQALARKKGCDEREPTSQLFSRISVTLMRGNAAMLNSRSHDVISAVIDGAE